MLPLSLKISALNNMALSKVLHHFYNSRINENILNEIDDHLTKIVRELYGMYNSTTRDVIYLPRTKGGIGVKMFSAVYRCCRISFVLKMLNHDEMSFKNIARQSLKLDMQKRGVQETDNDINFLGYEVNEKYYLVNSTNYGCSTNWMDLIRLCRKLKVQVKWYNGIACIFTQAGKIFDDKNLNKKLYNEVVESICVHARSLSLQGSFLNMQRIDSKISNTIHYNWLVSDDLVKFLVKARLNILPTNFTKYIWNRENDPKCSFCNYKTESIAHVLNGCMKVFKNFYSRRHDRIVDKIHSVIKDLDLNCESFNNKCVDTILPDFKREITPIVKRKPDILRIDRQNKLIEIIEVTVCYDLYFNYAYKKKIDDYTLLKTSLEMCGYKTKLIVLCFGSLGNIESNCYHELKNIIKDKIKLKALLKWCSISVIIGANYIWRNRVKKLLT